MRTAKMRARRIAHSSLRTRRRRQCRLNLSRELEPNTRPPLLHFGRWPTRQTPSLLPPLSASQAKSLHRVLRRLSTRPRNPRRRLPAVNQCDRETRKAESRPLSKAAGSPRRRMCVVHRIQNWTCRPSGTTAPPLPRNRARVRRPPLHKRLGVGARRSPRSRPHPCLLLPRVHCRAPVSQQLWRAVRRKRMRKQLWPSDPRLSCPRATSRHLLLLSTPTESVPQLALRLRRTRQLRGRQVSTRERSKRSRSWRRAASRRRLESACRSRGQSWRRLSACCCRAPSPRRIRVCRGRTSAGWWRTRRSLSSAMRTPTTSSFTRRRVSRRVSSANTSGSVPKRRSTNGPV